ncbi:AAA family ATPase [Nannocystis sp.]|uniref:AAA family ATPase n=1 Tax=Nannocystis sp. TaxID=1962667 RepID=UPI0025F04D7C|nr:AAA family ATPase [Nannocystis sp.]MBK7826030.1 AAA family ATPase [Nannocystis sp.]
MTETPLAALARSLRAGARGLVLRSDDEARAIRLLEDLGAQLGCPVHTWSAVAGCDGIGTPAPLPALLRDLAGRREPALWLLLDPPADPLAARALRELAQHNAPGPAAIVLGEPAPTFAQIPELADHALAPPELAELAELAAAEADSLRHAGHHAAADTLADLSPRASPSPPVPSASPPVPSASPPVPSASPPVPRASPPSHAPAHLSPVPAPLDLLRLALGLSEHAARRLLREAALAGAGDPVRAAARLVAAKAEALHRGALLELAEAVPEDMLGGLPGLKAWLRRRALALRPAARAAAIADPRGVLLVGVQGCGKSLAARVCADILGLGLVRLDPGRLFGGTVGESEANLRRLTAAAERLAPVVLWIDELDKGLVGSEGAASDAGTAARVLGGLLTWLQERARPVFVVATANRVDALPPELLRRGRLDETFFVDLPGPDERAAIAEIHLLAAPQRRLGRAPPLADPLPDFLATARAADGLSGAEIEGAVTEARLDAFAEARPLAAADLHRALAATIPLSRSRAAEVAALRSWATRFARPA